MDKHSDKQVTLQISTNKPSQSTGLATRKYRAQSFGPQIGDAPDEVDQPALRQVEVHGIHREVTALHVHLEAWEGNQGWK